MITIDGPVYRFKCWECSREWEGYMREMGVFCPGCQPGLFAELRKRIYGEAPTLRGDGYDDQDDQDDQDDHGAEMVSTGEKAEVQKPGPEFDSPQLHPKRYVNLLDRLRKDEVVTVRLL